MRFNGALFWEKWDNFQFSFLGENGLTNVSNAGGAEIKGVEAELNWAAIRRTYCYPAVSCTWRTGIRPRTSANRSVDADGNPLPRDECIADAEGTSEFAPKGTVLPVTPKFKGNVLARYTFNLGQFDAHVQGAYVYQGESRSALLPDENAILGDQGAYGIADFTAGIEKDGMSLEFFITNAFDERADLYRYAECETSTCGSGVGAAPGIIYSAPMNRAHLESPSDRNFEH